MGASPKEPFVRKLFDRITPRYDLFNRVASFGLDRRWRRRTVDSLNLSPGMRVLDLASGTGDLAEEVALRLLPLGEVVGADLSGGMLLESARRMERSPTAGWHVRLAQARAEQLPFPDGSFHAATLGFALRNVSDLERTFSEVHRVLGPNGRVGLLEFGRPKNPLLRVGHFCWLSAALPLIGLATTGLVWPFLYLRRSILGFMDPEEVKDLLRKAGFTDVKAVPMTGGAVTLYTARR